jgi:hypothetical protein
LMALLFFNVLNALSGKHLTKIIYDFCIRSESCFNAFLLKVFGVKWKGVSSVSLERFHKFSINKFV